MIPAQRQAVREQQRLDLLTLQQNEMQLMRDDYNAIGTTAALLAGFAFTGCADIDMPDGMHPDVKRTFYVVISATMVLMIYSVVIATICVVLGPDMLVNGAPPGAHPNEISCIVHRATGGMRIARKQIFGSFMCGLLLMMIATALVTYSKLGNGDENSTAAKFFGEETSDKAAAVCILTVFAIGIIAVIISVHGMTHIFDARREELFIRQVPGFPSDIPCEVCGTTKEEGMTKASRMYWFAFLPEGMRRCLSCRKGLSFKCYQCIGQRYSRREWMQTQTTEERYQRRFGTGDCCGRPEPAPRPPQTPMWNEWNEPGQQSFRRQPSMTDQVQMSQRRIDPSSDPFSTVPYGGRDANYDLMDEAPGYSGPGPRQRTNDSIGFSDGSWHVLEDGMYAPENSPTTERRSRMSRRSRQGRRSFSR